MSESDVLTEKFSRFIEVLRFEAKKLSDEERRYISNLDDFFPSCQLMIFKFGNLLHKYLIVTHDENQKDCEITIYEIDTWNAVNELEKISNYPRWDRKLSEEEKKRLWRIDNYSEIIEGQLIAIIKNMENSLFEKPPETFCPGKQMIKDRDFLWHIYDIEKFHPNDEAIKIVEQAKKQHDAESTKEPQKPEKAVISSPEQIKSHGTYFYLPIWLNEYPELSFREKIRGTRASFFFNKESITDSYKDRVVIIEENGFIGINEADKELAKRYLNEIMGTGLLYGLPFFSVRDGDISEITSNPDEFSVQSRQIIPRGNVLRQFDRNINYWEPDIHPHLSIEAEGLHKLLKISETLNIEPEVSDCLILLVESYTCLRSSQFIQSFIIGWTIIEKYLYWIWESHLRNMKVNHDRRKKLTESAEWSASSVIEMLEVVKKISKEDYLTLTELRKKRNNLIHEGEVIGFTDAIKCLEYSFNVMLSRTKAHEIYSGDTLTKYIIKTYNPDDFRF